MFFLRRGFNFVPTTLALRGFRDAWSFPHTPPQRPESVPLVRHRLELLGAAG